MNMGFKDYFLEMIKLSDEVKRMNVDIKDMDQSLQKIDRRLVRVETVIEFTGKGLINKRLDNEPK